MIKTEEQNILRLLSAEESRQQGFVALMKLYQQPLYWHIRRLVVLHEEAQDILQDTFINIYRSIETFKGNSSLKTWIYKIATNEAIRQLTKHRVETSSYDQNEHLLRLFEADDNVDFESTEAKLQKAILALSPKQRIIFNLRYYDQLEYAQIAEITNSSLSTLKTNYHYAKRTVTESLLKQMED